METRPFIVEFSVRDYECDFQGIVNNSVYLNYLEHCRHEFAKAQGLDVVALAHRGVNLVVVRVELEYKSPLRSGDCFVVETQIERFSRLRLAFHHTMLRRDTEQVILKARIITTAINDQGRPFFPDELQDIFQ